MLVGLVRVDRYLYSALGCLCLSIICPRSMLSFRIDVSWWPRPFWLGNMLASDWATVMVVDIGNAGLASVCAKVRLCYSWLMSRGW